MFKADASEVLVYVRSMIRNFLRNHTCSAQISCDTNEQISLFYTGPFSFSVMWRTYTLDIVNGYFAIFDIGDGNEPLTILTIVLSPAARSRCKKMNKFLQSKLW